jgi:hypothetical protein
MGKCIPVRAEMRWEYDAIDYIAMSDQFDPVPEGMMVPTYQVEITTLPDGESKATFKQARSIK